EERRCKRSDLLCRNAANGEVDARVPAVDRLRDLPELLEENGVAGVPPAGGGGGGGARAEEVISPPQGRGRGGEDSAGWRRARFPDGRVVEDARRDERALRESNAGAVVFGREFVDAEPRHHRLEELGAARIGRGRRGPERAEGVAAGVGGDDDEGDR